MQKKTLALCGTLLAASPAFAAPMNEVSLSFAAKADAEMALDGRLDEPCWAKAPVHSRFVEYYKAHPKPSALKSEMRVLYTDKALWIGLTHFEEHPEKLKVVSTTRDSVDWYEDMDEIYVDPFGDAIGFTKLLVNSAGVIGDMRRVDGSVVQNEWNGTAWRAKTSVGSDRWTVEVSLPYSDLQQPPVVGKSVWRLCVTRYQWTTGKFVGTVSSPKGAYNNPSGFGYLRFLAPGETPSAALAGETLSGKVPPPWSLWYDGQVLIDTGNGVVAKTEEQCREEERRETERMNEIKRRLAADFGGEE